MLVLCTVIWGGTFAAVKIALDDASPWLIVATRFAATGLLFVLIHFNSVKRLSPALLTRGIILGVTFFAGFGLQTLGLQYTTPSRSAFLTEALVLFTPLLAFAIYRKLPGWATVTGALIVISGLYFLTSPAGFPDWNRGDWMTLGCAAAFSCYIIGVDRWSSPETRGILSIVQSFTVAVVAGPFVFAENFRLVVNPTLLAAMLYLVVPGTVVVVMLQMRYQPQTTPARAGVIFALEPVFATLYAVLMKLEPWSLRALVGGAVVTAGVFWSELGSRKRK